MEKDKGDEDEGVGRNVVGLIEITSKDNDELEKEKRRIMRKKENVEHSYRS